ncbi:MAG TPA: hypothetical protein VMB53_16650 [Gaiellaceae bacterium]|nr:hypothetical protein [Gaiellaceae bacterium]
MTLRASILAAAVALGIVAGALAWSLRSSAAPPALPELHGTMSWAPGAQPAPPLAALRRLRGRTAILVLARPGCAGCADLRQELASVIRRLSPAQRPGLVVARGPSTPVVVLVDRRGDERTGYVFPFAPAFLEGDLRTLTAERLP